MSSTPQVIIDSQSLLGEIEMLESKRAAKIEELRQHRNSIDKALASLDAGDLLANEDARCAALDLAQAEAAVARPRSDLADPRIPPDLAKALRKWREETRRWGGFELCEERLAEAIDRYMSEESQSDIQQLPI